MTGVIEAVEAFDDPFLEAVVVGGSVCLHQPVTQALALLPEVAGRPALDALPARSDLVASGFLRESGSWAAAGGGEVSRGPVAATASFLGCYQVGGGAIVALSCDCEWLRVRLAKVLAPLAVRDGARGQGHADVVIMRDGCDTVSFYVNKQLIRAGVGRGGARRMALNIVLVEGLRHRGIGAIVHGSAVAREGRSVVIFGATGAGKSTLSVQLAARGWRHLADDLVPLGDEGATVHPFPVAASVKSGSWGVVAPEFAALMEQPVLTFGPRRVRYLDLQKEGGLPSAPVRPGLLVLAERVAGQEAPIVEMLSPEAAFTALIQTGSEAVGDPPSMRVLSGLVNRTRAVKLSFADVDRVSDVLCDLLSEGRDNG